MMFMKKDRKMDRVNISLIEENMKDIDSRIYFWESHGLEGEMLDVYKDIRDIFRGLQMEYETMSKSSYVRKSTEKSVASLNETLRTKISRLSELQDLAEGVERS